MPTPRPTYAVIGDPIGHSLSPRLFAFLFAELGIDAHYAALRVTPDGLAETLDLARRGLLAGLSVTIPHKEAVLPLLDDVHPAAARIGAVNTVARDGAGRLRGHNTDAPGLLQALEAGGGPVGGARVLLLGAGGAARAAAVALVGAGVKSVTIANRDPTRATRLALELVATGGAHPEGELRRRWDAGERPPPRPGLQPPPQGLSIDRPGQGPGRFTDPRFPAKSGDFGWLRPSGSALRPPDLASPAGRPFVTAVPLEARALAAPLAHADVVINATSCGLAAPADDPLPAGLALEPRQTVLDMVYRPLETALLGRARAAGATCVDGLWMLAFQALEALRLWTGRHEPDLAPRLHELLAEKAR